MFHSPSMWSRKAKGMALFGGSGDSKDKLMVAGLIVVIVAAGFALAMSIFGSKDKHTRIDKYGLRCINPKCNHEWVMSAEEFNKPTGQAPDPREADSARVTLCPKCGQKSGYRMSQCPKCEAFYVDNQLKQRMGQKPEEPEKCPKCGVVFGDWWKAHPVPRR
jgi:predicted RNA-binding Zn-ribbon protein involved in translation (DUF1610 family)